MKFPLQCSHHKKAFELLYPLSAHQCCLDIRVMHLCSLYCRRCSSAGIPYHGLHEFLNRHSCTSFCMACSYVCLLLSLSFTFTAPQNFCSPFSCSVLLSIMFPSSAVVLRAPSQVDLRRALESAWQRCMGYPELQAALQPRAG